MKYFIILIALIYTFITASFAADLASVINHIEEELDFEKNNYKIMQENEEFVEQRASSKSNIYKNFPESIKNIENILTHLKKYQQDGLYPNILLRKIFELRYQEQGYTSLDWAQNILESLKTDYNDACWIISDMHVENLAKIPSKQAHWNHIISRTSLDRFQLLSLIIKQVLFDMKNNNHSLCEENEIWLRCARTLHPYLTGEIEILEHPEHALGVDLPVDTFGNELALCSYYFNKKVPIYFPDRSMGAKKDVTSMVSFYEFKQLPNEITERPITKDLIAKYHLNPKQEKFLELPPFSYPNDLRFFSSVQLLSETIGTPTSTADNYSGLNSSVNETIATEKMINTSNSSVTSQPEKTLGGTKNEMSHEEKTQEKHREFSPIIESTELIEANEPVENNTDEEGIDPQALHLEHQALKQRKFTSPVGPTSTPMLTPQEIWIQTKLNSDEIKWLEKLLNHRLKVVAYRDFARVWEKLNGKKSIVASKKGSSHFKLLNKDGQVVGGIFTHGSGQEYWNGAVQSLRNLFDALGITADIL